jgi:Lon-like protease
VKKLLWAMVVALVLLGLVVVPLPLVALMPGVVLSVEDGLELEGEVDPIEGQFLLTTVRVTQPTTLGVIRAVLDDRVDLVPQRQVIPEGVDPGEFSRRQQALFTESARVAAAVALDAAGLEVTISGSGAEVIAVVPGAPADDRLEPGDVVVAIDGTPVSLVADLVALAGEAEAGDVLVLTVEREGERRGVRIEIQEVGELGRPGLGVLAATVDQVIDLPVEVRVVQEGVGGPSGGLLMALTIYDLVHPDDVAAGRQVAGSGAIGPGGRVGSVGGITQKVAAAVEAGASVFLVPAGEADEAAAAAGDRLEVIAVETFDEALAALRS